MDYVLDLVKRISEYGPIWILFIIIYYFIKFYKYKEEEENNLILKMIGFYLLGSFTFNFNGLFAFPIVLPIGYLIYCLFLKNKSRPNSIVKHKCALLGVCILIFGYVNGFIYNSLEYRSYTIKTYSSNVNYLDEDWAIIEERLKLKEDLLLTEFRVNYDEKDKISSLYFSFTDPYEMDKCYIVRNSGAGLIVDVSKVESDDIYSSYNNYGDYYQANVGEFMDVISNIEFNVSPLEKDKEISEYYAVYEANNSTTMSTGDDDDSDVYIIDSVNKDEVVYREAKSRELPLNGVLINYAPMEKISEGSGSSIYHDTYALYAYPNNQLLKDDTKSLIVQKVKEDKSIEYTDYDYKINDIVYALDSSYWEEVESSDLESSAVLKLDNNEGTIITLYENSYATYENSEEEITYKIPESTIGSVLDIIGN